MYTIIEPKILADLLADLDNDNLVKSLEYIKTLLPKAIVDLSKKCEIKVIAVSSPHGGQYPAYGLIVKDNVDFDKLQDEIDNLISKYSIADILEGAKTIDYINWDTIKA